MWSRVICHGESRRWLRKKRDVVGFSADWEDVESRRCCGVVVLVAGVGVGMEFVRLVGRVWVGRVWVGRDGEA